MTLIVSILIGWAIADIIISAIRLIEALAAKGGE